MQEKRAQVQIRLNEVFKGVFNDDDIVISDATSSKDLEDWDSLMHISLIVATEKAFGVRLNAAEVARLANVGAMIDLLIAKTENS